MTVLFCSKTNQAVTLTVSIAHSGEGEVWRTDRPGVLAKIYHVPKSHEIEKLAQMQERVAKLEVMVKRVPKDPNAHQNHISFAWPQSLLSNNEGEVVGFLMPEVENSLDLLKVCTPRLRKSLKLEISWYFLHVVARNVASIIQAIHYEGYVLGDIKLQNILVNNRALPTIIDTDSFQVIDPFENKIYRCLVGSEGFTPPELISQDIAMVTQSPVHDHFRLGVVIYYLLFSGPPFQGQWIGSGEPPEEAELIRRGLWPFASNSLIQPSKTTIPLNIIHPELERCFLRCFNEGHGMPYKRPTAEVWLKALEVAINDLVSCGKLDSHFYSSIFGRCYWCDRVQDLGVDIFPGNEITTTLNVFSSQNVIQQIGSASSSHSGSPIISTVKQKFSENYPQKKLRNISWVGLIGIFFVYGIIGFLVEESSAEPIFYFWPVSITGGVIIDGDKTLNGTLVGLMNIFGLWLMSSELSWSVAGAMIAIVTSGGITWLIHKAFIFNTWRNTAWFNSIVSSILFFFPGFVGWITLGFMERSVEIPVIFGSFLFLISSFSFCTFYELNKASQSYLKVFLIFVGTSLIGLASGRLLAVLLDLYLEFRLIAR